MSLQTISHEYAEVEALLRDLPNNADIGFKRGEFSAMCHEPDDVVRGVFCCGRGPTLAEAIAKMREKMEAAKRAHQKLRTAAECKAAVLMRASAITKLAGYGITLDPSRSELCAFAEIDGIWCRAMFDNAPEDPRQPLYDYKTCEDASPESCLKSIINYGYDVQAAHYLAVWKAITGEDRRFTFIFQEKPAPHEVTLITLSGSFRDLGDNRAARARKLWRECITTNNWPGYPAGVHEVDAPAWLIEREYQEAA